MNWTKNIILALLFLSLIIAAQSVLYPLSATADPSPDFAIIPLSTAQEDSARHNAYKQIFSHLHTGQPAHIAAQPFNYSGEEYMAGTLIIPDYTCPSGVRCQPVTTTLSLTQSYALHFRPIAIFRSDEQDERGGNLTSAAARYESILDAGYLNGAGRCHDMLNETAIITGGALTIDNYGLLLIPRIKKEYETQVEGALGAKGLNALAEFVDNGGMIYAEGDGAYLVEAAGLVPTGTVDLENRVTAYDTGNIGQLTVADRALPLTWNWLEDSTYVLDDPVLHPLTGSAVATYTNTSTPGATAILHRQFDGGGQVLLYSGHPSNHSDYIPQFLAAVLHSFADRVELTASVTHPFSGTAAADLFPGREADIPVSISILLEPTFPVTLTNVTFTETIQPEFLISETLLSALTPSAAVSGRDIVWTVDEIAPGAPFTVTFPVFTRLETLSQSVATVSEGYATYHDPLSGGMTQLEHQPLRIQSKMAARLFGDRDIEPDRLFYIPAEGLIFDVYHTYENKEETTAVKVRVVEIIPLIVPIVELENQAQIINHNDRETIWILNEPFLDNEDYPRPLGYEDFPAGVNITLTHANATVMYDVPNGFHADPHPPGWLQSLESYNYVTIPPTYTKYITVTADNKLVVPALRLEWDLSDWTAYHYEEPAVRYGIQSREYRGRDIYFDQSPRPEPSVTLPSDGGSIYTLVGDAPVSYRQALLTGSVVYWPTGPEVSRVEYEDIWGRVFTMPLRSAFYDVFDADTCACNIGGSGYSEHHVGLASTFELRVGGNRVKEYASKSPAEVEWLIRVRGLASLESGETLLDVPIPRSFRTQLSPDSGDWRTSWVSETLDAELVAISETNSLTHLFFHVDLTPNEPTAIRIRGVITPFGKFKPDNIAVKIAEGPVLMHRQEVAGPSRYEIVYCHVQGVRAHAQNIELSKQVCPNLLSVHGDEFIYQVDIKDRSAENRILSDPYLVSYGYDDLTITGYIGGREGKKILHSVLRPSEASPDYTTIRYEINNNTGVSLTNVAITPDVTALPTGITVTQIMSDAVPPQFPELPFLNVDTIRDAWRGVYYFRLEVDDTFPAELRGQALTIPFSITADNLPATVTLPLPMYGVVDSGSGDEVYAEPNFVSDLVLTDAIPSFVNIAGARIANATEASTLKQKINDDRSNNTTTAPQYFAGLREDINVATAPDSAVHTFTLTGPVAQLPWTDHGNLNSELHVLLWGTVGEMLPGRYLANEGAQLEYSEDEGQRWITAPSNPVYLEIHGSHLTTTYRVRNLTRVFNNQELLELFPGEENEVEIETKVGNDGDDLALGVVVTTRLPLNVRITDLSAAAQMTVSGQNLIWQVGDLGDGVEAAMSFTLVLTPTITDNNLGDVYVEATDTQLPLMNSATTQFIDDFSERVLVLDTTSALSTSVEPAVLVAPLELTVEEIGAMNRLVWNAVPGDDVEYYVYRSESPRTGFRLINTTREVNQWDDVVPTGHRFYYAVVAARGVNEQGLHSNVVGVGQFGIYLPLIMKNG